jgi:hypothetical protein
VDAVVVEFTDPISGTWDADDPDTWPLAFTMDGVAAPVGGSFSLSGDSLVLTFTPDSPIPATLGAWGLTVVAGNVRDTSGLRLYGDPLVLGEYDYETAFGAVGWALPSLGSCAPDTTTFQPDGDAGVGPYADEVTLRVSGGTGPPDLWRLDVADADGARVRSVWALGTDLGIAWDGRGDHGRIEPTGDYVLTLYGLDRSGNEAEACDASVALRAAVERR